MRSNLIAVSGLMQSGKTTVVSMIQEYLADKNYWNTQKKSGLESYQAKLIKFAQPLYDIQDFAYSRINKPTTKDRKLLQFLGTDWGRGIDENLWVDLWRAETRSHLFKTGSLTHQVVLCDDLRFDNEAEQVKALGGKIIWVEADADTRRERSPGTFSGTQHASEGGIKQTLVDLYVYNSGNKQDLKKNIQYLMETIL